MKEIILIKNGELALKGLNRATFEEILLKNLRRRLKPLGAVEIRRAQSTVYIEPADETFPFADALEQVGQVFGIAAYTRACVAEKNMDDILEKAAVYLKPQLQKVATFKVEAKRADKGFSPASPEICRLVGGALLAACPHLRVDVHNPDLTVMVEVRDFGAYIHGEQLPGAGGLPVGTAGRAAVLISGGIDSPVAAWTMAKRGLTLNAVHFASPPYTSARAEQKVRDLLERVARYSGVIRLAVVPFTELQEAIGEHCPEDFFTLIMRRMMMRIATRIANDRNCGALITGESLGQVASQTLQALAVTDAAAGLPVLRPLIGMDKDEIVAVARKIDTFEISIQPFEDCCTVFTPRHPKTRPTIAQCDAAEASFDWEPLLERAVAGTTYSYIESTDGKGIRL